MKPKTKKISYITIAVFLLLIFYPYLSSDTHEVYEYASYQLGIEPISYSIFDFSPAPQLSDMITPILRITLSLFLIFSLIYLIYYKR